MNDGPIKKTLILRKQIRLYLTNRGGVRKDVIHNNPLC